MNGTANLNNSTAEFVIDDPFDNSKRLVIVQATHINGTFKDYKVKNDVLKSTDGSCHKYSVASSDTKDTTVTVILNSVPTACVGKNPRSLLILGVTVGVLGSLALLMGLLWVFRDVASAFARRTSDQESLVV